MTLVFEKRVKCVFVVPQSINPARDKQNKPCSVEWRRSVPAFAVTDLSDPRNNCMLFVLFWSCWGFFFTSSSRPDERCTTAILISLFAPFKWTITTPSSCHTWRDMIHVHRGWRGAGKRAPSSTEENLDGDWANLSSREFEAGHSEFLLSTEPGSNSEASYWCEGWHYTRVTAPWWATVCCSYLISRQSHPGVKWKHLFNRREVSLLLFVLLL